MEKHSLSDLLSSAQKVRGLLLQRLESEKSQWLFPEVEWSLYSLHTQRINGCYKSSSCAEQRALPCPSRPAGSPRGHGAATHGCHRRGRVAQCTNAALVAGVTGHCSPGGSLPLSVPTTRCPQRIARPRAPTSSPFQGLASRTSSTEPLWISHPPWMPSAGLGLSLGNLQSRV